MVKTPLEETSYWTLPSKSKIPSFRPFFSWCKCNPDYVIRTAKGIFENFIGRARRQQGEKSNTLI